MTNTTEKPKKPRRLSTRERKLGAFLEGLYADYSRQGLVSPDPLEFLNGCDLPDREVVGLVASSLAYGRVAGILRNVRRVLDALGARPHRFLLDCPERIPGLLGDFRHRFTTAEDVETMLSRTAAALAEHGSLEALLKHCLHVRSGELLPAVSDFAEALWPADRPGFPLVASPRSGSACKRLFLFLKWMVRRDDVDPGGWGILSPADLIMPVDTHVHHIARSLGLTERKQADIKTALEITRAFARLCPEDPTRYDFVITRFGIRNDMKVEDLISGVPIHE